MEKAWSLRSYREGDEDSIFELVRAVWGEAVPDKEKWLKGWKWMFTNNPASSSIIWLAEDNSKLVSQYPVIRENMMVKGQLVKGTQLVDTMTHPEYRRWGIAFALGQKVLSKIEKEEVCLVYCFPTQEVYPLHMKSGWLDVCALQVMFKPLNLRNLLEEYLTRRKSLLKILTLGGELFVRAFSAIKKPPEVKGLTIIQISYFDDRFNDLWNEISGDYPIIVVRDKEYLNWRYVNTPNTNYTIYVAEREGEVCGYIVLASNKVKNLKFGYIYDIIASLSQEDIIQCLISKAVEHFRGERVDAVTCSMVAIKTYRNAFLKNGFIPRLGFKSRFIVYNASLKFSKTFLEKPKNWFIQQGDLPTVY